MRRLTFGFAISLLAVPSAPAQYTTLPTAAAAAIPPLIPIDHFAAQPVLSSPHVSPNGSRIAAVADVKDQTRIAVLDAERPEAKPLLVDLGKVPVSDIHWAGENRLLLEARASATFLGIRLPLGRLIILDLLSGQSRVADQKSKGIYGGDVLFSDPTGSWALVASQNDIYSTPSVKRIDLATGDAIVVQRALPDVWDWFVDENGVVRGGVAYSDRKWKLYYRSSQNEAFRTLRGKFEKDDDSSVDRFIFGRDGRTGVVVANEKTGRFGVYKYDYETAEIGAVVFESPTADINETLLDPSTNELAGVRYHDDRWRTFWLDPGLKALQLKLDKALPGVDNLILRHPGKSARVLVWSSGASEPGTYFLLDRKTSTMKPVVQPYDRIDPALLAKVEPVHYAARDGLDIPAYLTLPRGRDPKALPLILMPHGGPFSRDEWTYDPLVQFLANRGYAVLQPQFRGSTGYGKDFVARGYGEWGRKMQDDLDDGVDWLARTGKIDPKRVCIVGASYGGYAALWGAIRNPERYRCAASLAGVTDLEQQLRNNRKSFSAVRYFREWRTKVQGETKFDLKAVSPLAQAARLKVPVLIAHGEADETVSVSQGRQLADALQLAKADVSPVFYKDADHDFTNSEDLADFLRRLETFLAKHNPATAPLAR
jgi:dipeptidyl aminopeptidase/acylaminoacyl peptidase